MVRTTKGEVYVEGCSEVEPSGFRQADPGVEATATVEA